MLALQATRRLSKHHAKNINKSQLCHHLCQCQDSFTSLLSLIESLCACCEGIILSGRTAVSIPFGWLAILCLLLLFCPFQRGRRKNIRRAYMTATWTFRKRGVFISRIFDFSVMVAHQDLVPVYDLHSTPESTESMP